MLQQVEQLGSNIMFILFQFLDERTFIVAPLPPFSQSNLEDIVRCLLSHKLNNLASSVCQIVLGISWGCDYETFNKLSSVNWIKFIVEAG